MTERLCYLDYAATTPVDPRVIAAMQACLGQDGNFGNPASVNHHYGQRALQAIEHAQAQVASLIGANPNEIIWTSGATESDNLAILGAAQFYQRKGRHLITLQTEHKAVLDSCRYLESTGFEVTYLKPQANGLIDLQALEQAIRPDTILVSVMHVNSEIGVIQDLAAISRLVKSKGILLHSDAAQSAGKIPVNVEEMGVDLLSLSAHKVYGPKGAGALYVRHKPRVRLAAQIHGGGHQQGLRSGTLPTHQLVGMGEAFALAEASLAAEASRLLTLRDKLLAGIEPLTEVFINGDINQRIPGNLNCSFGYVDGEALMLDLGQRLAVSSGSACTTASLEPSYVLKALGVSDTLAHSAVRFSLGRFTTDADIALAIAQVNQSVQRLRALSPLWANR